MKLWHIYELATGLFTGHAFALSPYDPTRAAAEIPEGCGAIEGEFDWQSQRVDVESDPPAVIDYQPPAPTDTDEVSWAWDTPTRRWVTVLTFVGKRRSRVAEVQSAIQALETRYLLPRATREILLASPPPSAPALAVAHVQSIEDQVVALRAVRTALNAAADQAALDAVVWP